MPKIFILSGPSGIGKSYTSKRLLSLFPDSFAYSRVHTTRPKRQHETRADERIFVSPQAFQALIDNDEFFVYELFADYLYGYCKAHLQPGDKHLIVDVSPWLLPKFATYDNAVFVGLQAHTDFTEQLDARMQGRGDSQQIRMARYPFIRRDVQDLDKQQALINQRGKFFHIQDNQTIPEQVIPWAVQHLGLAA